MNNENATKTTATPYDDVHRTMLNDCPKLIIPVVNEMFHKRHSDNEQIQLLNNEFFVNRQNGEQVERITDTHFMIGSIRYHLECQSTVDVIFEKKLFFLIPFHLFTYEKDFNVYEENPQKLQELTEIYEEIVERLNECEENGVIDERMKTMIVDMSKKVLEHLAKKHSNVKKGVGDIMGGEILEYPSKTAWRQATEEGRREGLREGRREGLCEGIREGKRVNCTL